MPPSPLALALAVVVAVELVVLMAIWSRLRTLGEIKHRLQALERQLAEREPSPGSSSNPAPFSRRAASFHRADPAESTAIAGPTLISVPSLATPTATGPAAASADLTRRFGAIWTLADSGAPAAAIAKQTGQPIGQVELILGLRRQLTPERKKPTGGRI